MILTKIILHNFGIYAGRHEIDLTPKPDRPVILFGALNGSGKTTLLEGIQFALFGKNARFLPKNKSAYIDFLTNTVNRRNLQDSASVGVEFIARRGGKRSRYTVIRTWLIRSSCGHEKPVQVFLNDELDDELSTRWEELAETFFPSQLSELFFFDGERIEQLAQPVLCAQLIRTGLNTLLGLDLVSDLSKTLVILGRRLKVETVSTSEKQSLVRAQDRVELLKEQRSRLDQEIQEKSELLATSDRELIDAQDLLRAQGGDLYLRREELKLREEQLLSGILETRNHLVNLSGGDLQLLLVVKIIDELGDISSKGLTADQQEAVAEALTLFSKTVLTELASQVPNDSDVLRRVSEIHAAYLSGVEKNSSVPNIAFARRELSRIKVGLNTSRSQALSGLLNLGKFVAELESIQAKLIAVPDEQKLGPLVVQVTEIEKECYRLKDEIAALDVQHKRLDNELSQAEAALAKVDASIADKRSEEVRGSLMRTRLDSAKSVLRVFEDRIRNRHIAYLEKHIKYCYELLNRKKAFIKSVMVDPESYSLRLNIVGNGVVPATKLSAAERQLLAVAVLWSLSRMSSRKLPTIIDTPMGRLDSKNRKKVVENYFPVAGDQVILLSTDEEIVGQHYRSIKKHVANQYLIEYDDDSQSSQVYKGYFENAREAA